MKMRQMNASGLTPLSSMNGALRAVLVGAGLLAVVPGAWAQSDEVPLYLTLAQHMKRESNLIRDNSQKVPDTISTSQARVGLAKAYGRQSYNLDATISKNKYKTYSQFDNDSHAASGTFASEILSDFLVTVKGRSARELPSFESNIRNRLGRNTERQKSVSMDLRYGLHGRMSVNGGLTKTKVQFDQTIADDRDSESRTVGLRYSPADLLSFGLNYTNTDTDAPNLSIFLGAGQGAQRTGEEIHRDTIQFHSSWTVTGYSVFDGGIGYTKEKYRFDERRNFNGVTGSLSWRYTPNDKSKYSVRWSRDTNNSGSYSNFVGYFANNKISSRLVFEGDWTLTSKITLNGSYTYGRDKEEKAGVVTATVDPSDDLYPYIKAFDFTKSDTGIYQAASLGLDYTPFNFLGLGCSVTYYDRNASALTPNAYNGRTVACYAGVTFD